MNTRKLFSIFSFKISLLVFLASIFFSYQGISFAADDIKESAKEAKKNFSEMTKSIVDQLKKDKDLVVEDAKESWISVRKAAKNISGEFKQSLSDSAISAKIATKFLLSKKRADFENIEHDIKAGTVTLKGKVKTSSDAVEAIRLVMSIKGVERVVSSLEVTGKK